MGYADAPHPDWKTEAGVAMGFQRMRRGDQFLDRYVAYITGEATNGTRYCRTVEVTGREIESGYANRRLERILSIVLRYGPGLCVAIKEEGDYPSESEQPPIEV